MNKVKAGIFSLTPPAPTGYDGSYLRWHLLDHLPEEQQLPGIVHGMRWIADGAYPDHRIAADGPLADVGNVVNYLVGDPVEPTFAEFFELGRRLAENGRYPEVRPSLQVAALSLLRWDAAPQALISPEAVPFRPHRGVLLIIEEPTGADTASWLRWLHTDHYPALLTTSGTAGAWTYGTTTGWNLGSPWSEVNQYISVVYLDADPLDTTRALSSLVRRRWSSGAVKPLFAGPLRTMIQWEAWP